MNKIKLPINHSIRFWQWMTLALTCLIAYFLWQTKIHPGWLEIRRTSPSHAYVSEDRDGKLFLEYAEDAFSTEKVDFEAAEVGIFSQSGEDGVIAKIFERIEPTNKYAVEFGGGTQINNSNVRHLFADLGWKGLLLEGDEKLVKASQEVYADNPNVTSLHQWVYPGNIETIFEDNQVPRDLDLLVIDIDSNDYWCWRALQDYRPKVLLIEVNGLWKPPIRFVIEYNPFAYWDYGDIYGASLQSLYELGKKKGYELLYMTKNGVNAFFVEKKYFARFGIRDNRPSVIYRAHLGTMAIDQNTGQYLFDEQGHPLPYPSLLRWKVNLPPWTWEKMTIEKKVRFDLGYKVNP